MLDQGRYTWRHNAVLRIILDNFSDLSDPAWKVYCYLLGTTKIAGTTIPPDIIPTKQRPDLVFVNDSSKTIVIFELTVPFEQNIEAAHVKKSNKYSGLTSDLQEQGYDAKLICFEVGSRGMISHTNKCRLQSIFPTLFSKPMKRAASKLLKSISKRAISCSYSIFYSKYDHEWSTNS